MCRGGGASREGVGVSSLLGGGRVGNYLWLFSFSCMIRIVVILWVETGLVFLFFSPLFSIISRSDIRACQ